MISSAVTSRSGPRPSISLRPQRDIACRSSGSLSRFCTACRMVCGDTLPCQLHQVTMRVILTQRDQGAVLAVAAFAVGLRDRRRLLGTALASAAKLGADQRVALAEQELGAGIELVTVSRRPQQRIDDQLR